MSISSIPSTTFPSLKPAQNDASSTKAAAAKAAQQEATETAAQTAQEAHNGDRAAIRTLQHLPSHNQPPAPAVATEDTEKGNVVDQHA